MFYITLLMDTENNKKTVASMGGAYTEGKKYPVLKIMEDNGLGFLIPDDTGEIRRMRADLCRYVREGGEPAMAESRQPEAAKPGRKPKNTEE